MHQAKHKTKMADKNQTKGEDKFSDSLGNKKLVTSLPQNLLWFLGAGSNCFWCAEKFALSLKILTYSVCHIGT